MAKYVKRFNAKGELNLEEGIIYEIKNSGKKDEEIIDIDFFEMLREFDGKSITLTIVEEKEISGVHDIGDYEENEL